MSDASFAPFPLISWLDRRTRTQKLIVAGLLGAYIVWFAVGGLASTLLDRWWIVSVTDAPLWGTRAWAVITVTSVSAIVSIAVMLTSWVVSNRLRGPRGQLTFRPIAFVAGRLGPLRTWTAWLLPLYFGARIAAAAADYWQEWVLFRNSAPIGSDAPEVGRDLAYHLYTLPLAQVVLDWLTQLLLVTIAGSMAFLILNGALRLHIRGRRSNPAAIRLLLVLSAAFFLVQAIGYWWVRYPSLASTSDGRFGGPSWALMHSRGLLYRPLAILSLIAALLLIASVLKWIRFRHSLSLAVAIVVLHVGGAILLPAALQRLVVNPSEFAREESHLEHNLQATQTAFGLTEATTDSIDLNPNPSSTPQTDRIPRFDKAKLSEPFQALQGTRGTQITNVDLDRYQVDGSLRPVFLAARVPSRDQLPDQSWVNTHLVYTHGDGVVATLADSTTASGSLNFDGLQDDLGSPASPIYFGEGLKDWYAFVGTAKSEVGGTTFDAGTGVGLQSGWRQLIAGLALGDYNIVTSSDLGEDTQLLYRRSINERITSVAPFLRVDSDPYPVITDEGVVWIADTYVTSNTYPYAQNASVPNDSGLTGEGFNYLEHAAVATIDAQDGTVRLYRTDGPAPLTEAWARALPGLFTPIAEMPAEIDQHRRYPVDQFIAQTNLLGRYHVDNAEDLYSGDDAWLVSPVTDKANDDNEARPSRPSWQFIDAFGGDWVSTRPFSPGQAQNPSSGRTELAAIAVANHDEGTLSLIRTGSTSAAQLPSPSVAQSILESDPEISQLLTLLNANGSTVEFGPNTPLIGDDGFWWYRTIVVTSTAEVSTPRLHSSATITDGGLEIIEQPDHQTPTE